MNSKNSSVLESASTSRSTFLHTTFPQRSWTSNFTLSRRLFAHTGGLTGSPLLLKGCSATNDDQERCTDRGWTCNDEV